MQKGKQAGQKQKQQDAGQSKGNSQECDQLDIPAADSHIRNQADYKQQGPSCQKTQ